MAKNDRLFINKFDNFIYTIRKIIYFGDVTQQKNIPTKHEKKRFIDYFGWESKTEYYEKSNYLFDFSNDSRLKDEFANLYSYKSMSNTEMGDSLQLFSAISSKQFDESFDISGTRNLKNFNRRIESKSELAESGSILISGANPRKYKKNTQLTKNFNKKDKTALINAIDFAIKKNNFTSFASTYKRMLVCRDSLENNDCNIEIDHQLFNPILDEIHIWEAVLAISEGKGIDIKYIKPTSEIIYDINDLIPVKIIYDNLYGRTYLFTYNPTEDLFSTFRFDRIYSISTNKNDIEAENLKNYREKLDNILSTAWLVSTNQTTEHVVIRFINTVQIRERIKNEGRHGKITGFDNDFFTYEIDVNDSYEMINWVLNFGSSCVVEQPMKLREKIIEHLKDMSQ